VEERKEVENKRRGRKVKSERLNETETKRKNKRERKLTKREGEKEGKGGKRRKKEKSRRKTEGLYFPFRFTPASFRLCVMGTSNSVTVPRGSANVITITSLKLVYKNYKI
jgi:hypothetical protein